MKVIPVLDVLNSVAVHAIRGERREYLPLKSVLCASADPIDLAKAFKSFGFNELYLADLDSILGVRTNFNIYKQIKAETALDLMVDAGINDVGKAERILENGASQIIIGTETLNNLDFIRESVKLFGRYNVIVSIDLKKGKILSRTIDVNSEDIVSLAETLEKMDVTKVIILDLSRVGTEAGVNLAAVGEVLKRTKLEVLTGGGICGIKDLEELRVMGVSAVLVATALHAGKLTIGEMKSKGFLQSSFRSI